MRIQQVALFQWDFRAFKIYYKRISRQYDLTPAQAENSLIQEVNFQKYL